MSHLSVRVLHSLLVTYCPVVPVNFVIVDVKKCKYFNPSTGSRGQIDPRPYKLFNIQK